MIKSSQNQLKDKPIDPLLPEKKRARRRLIGSIALMLAAIIVFPIIFDKKPKNVSSDINIQIPSSELSISSKVNVEKKPVNKEKKKKLELIFESDKNQVKVTGVEESKLKSNQLNNKFNGSNNIKTKKNFPKKFILQVTAIPNKVNTRKLQNRLKEQGINSFSQKIITKGGERYRIRVGPFDTKEEADRILLKLSNLGLPGKVGRL